MNNISQEYKDLKKRIKSYIDKFPSPTKKENKENLEKLEHLKKNLSKNNNKIEYRKLRDYITLSNGGFAMNKTVKYSLMLNDGNEHIFEIFQEAMLGIIETIDMFDLSKDVSFTTYANFHVKKRIIDYIKYNKLIRAPRNVARNMHNVSIAQDKLLTFLEREPEIEEIKDELIDMKDLELKNRTIKDIVNLLELSSSRYNKTFITEYNEESKQSEESDNITSEFAVTLEDQNNLFNKILTNIEKELRNFDDQSKEAIKMRFGIKRSYSHMIDDIAIMLNESIDTIRKRVQFESERLGMS